MTSIVLIHGTNAGPWTMVNLAQHFAAEGRTIHSPAYRFHDPSPSEENRDQLTNLSIADYVDDIATAVSGLGEKPILIGHSLGGIVAQKLAARGMARAIVLLNGSVNHGTLPTTDEERALGRALMAAGPFWDTVLLPDFETMAHYGLNKLPQAEQAAVFQKLGPESGRVMFELFFWMFDANRTTEIDYAAVDCPVLSISGSDDLAIPPSTARTIAQKHRHATFREAKGFGHYMQLEPDWREIADIVSAWLEPLP
ncbi:MAG: alpha/beta hydrolase [Pseudomonadota bacterium]